ncbi:MAG: FHIPEP family type III secretion protein [Deltaproteobacteria bacterium]|nr:FHIPEP family type III secretion protein [Deltaproteobacteria bacterium]
MRNQTNHIGKFGNLAVAGLVMAILILMVIPLPTFILDLLLTLNIAISATLLLVALHITEPLKIAAFPSMLLIATMFRLGLNVSSTRLILLNADAGTVIDSFGQFVVSGNLIVGGVVFLILTIIQFVVIAKGSERVAEVAARFTLDAMPGKQMSIDAELRSGHISYEQARRQRSDLQRQSQMYGAMDGAMKFVKGDAIAGLIITAINILAGLGTGIAYMDMTASEALQTYSVLTIGDGLVSQIPSLLISLSSGFIITRVASEEKGSQLGGDILSQITSQPVALGYTGGLLILLALVPGMPGIPFFILGSGLVFLMFRLRKNSQRSYEEEEAPITREGDSDVEKGALVPPLKMLMVEIGAGDEVFDSDMIKQYFSELRNTLFWKYGMLIPPVKLIHSPGIGSGKYNIYIREQRYAGGFLSRDQIIFLGDVSTLDISPSFFSSVDFALPELVAYSIKDDSILSSLPPDKILDADEFIFQHSAAVIEKNLFELMNPDTARILVNSLEKTQSALVEECYPAPVNLTILNEILKRLLEEGISIRPLDRIMYSLKKWLQSEGDPLILTEYVRIDLKKEISGSLSDGNLLGVYIASEETEDEIRAGIQKGLHGSFLSVDPDAASEIQQKAIELKRNGGVAPLTVVSSMDVRRYLRQLLIIEVPDVRVLSYQELDSNVSIQPFGEL